MARKKKLTKAELAAIEEYVNECAEEFRREKELKLQADIQMAIEEYTESLMKEKDRRIREILTEQFGEVPTEIDDWFKNKVQEGYSFKMNKYDFEEVTVYELEIKLKKELVRKDHVLYTDPINRTIK